MQSLSNFSGDLTLLYTETKKKALNSTGKNETIPSLSHLNRKLRIQKDRLVTWGLEWTDQDKGSGGDIDASVAQAGVTETVTSVLGNIWEVLEQAEKINSPLPSWSSPEKLPLSTNDEASYEDLIKDLSSSIDVLYEISITRRAIAAGSHPSFSSDRYQHEFAPGTIVSESSPKKKPFQTPSFASSELTLVNPSFARPNLSPYAGLPASIDPHALQLPPEAPPPYESFGVPSATRMIGSLIKSKVPESVRRVLRGTSSEAHVLVEYANYDSLYHETGVPPPLQRLEALALALAAAQAKQQRSLILLGYFEDPQQPRIGLVYDFLSAVHGGVYVDDLVPVSLLNLVQTANKGAKPADVLNAMPFLEDRFKVALRVAENLRDLHAEGFSHGNLNSGSVMFFRQGQNPQLRRGELHRPTLSAFDMFSGAGVGRRNSNQASSINITKHPHDHGAGSNNVKAVQYDLYGLALLLLEIGLWVPLHDLYKAKYTLKDFKLRIEKIWIPRLASKCGSLYMRAVQTCLRLSDDPEIDKIDTAKLYESIIRRLQRCCFLDEDEPILLESDAPQDQAALWQSLATRRHGEAPEQAHHRTWSQDHLSSSSFSMRSGSSVRDDVDQAAMPNIATTMSQNVESLSPVSPEEHFSQPTDISPVMSVQPSKSLGSGVATTPTTILPFREYRRKVILVQRRWRDCCKKMADKRNAPAVPHDSSHFLHSHAHTAERRTSLNEARRSSESVRRCQVFPIKLPQPALDDWHTNLGLRISRIVERALKDSTESSSIDLVGFGHDCFTAKPTILVTCASTARVKAALKRKFDYDKSKFDLKVRKGRIALARGKGSAREQLAKRTSGGAADNDDGESDALNPYFQQRPLCGASIGAYLPSYGHLDPVSYGGVIMIEQQGKMQSFGMSVHHMLDPPEEDEQSSDAASGAFRSSTSSGSELDTSESSDSIDTSDDDSDTGYISSEFESDISDEELIETGRAHGGGHNHRSRHEPGDKPGIKAHSLPTIQITQPAFLDAWNQNLHADDAPLDELDEDHLASYKFGQIYASSGLRRVTKNGMRHEIDWALLKLDPPRLQPFNLVQGGRRYSPATTKTAAAFCPNLEQPICRQSGVYTAEEDLYPLDVVPSSKLAGLDVHCFGRTSGLANGTINAYVSFVKIRGRHNFSTCWSVLGAGAAASSASSGSGGGSSGFGVGGDSGAWIIDNATSRVCGHVLAEREGMAYLCSMQLLFEDIKATLGASRVLLPGSEDAETKVGREVGDVATLGLATQLGEDIAGAVARLDIGESAAAREGRGGVRESGTPVQGQQSARRSRFAAAAGASAAGISVGVGRKGECARLGKCRHTQTVRTCT